jgi:hypothetical protein
MKQPFDTQPFRQIKVRLAADSIECGDTSLVKDGKARAKATTRMASQSAKSASSIRSTSRNS